MKNIVHVCLNCLCIFLLAAFTNPVFAQPAWSRGIQILPLNHSDCLGRAQRALENEGYYIQNRGSDFMAGQKGIHSAVITCNATADGRSYVNIFVASQSRDAGIPGAERVRLQGQMDKSSTASNVIQATWTTQALTYRGKNGERFTYYIPPNGSTSGRLWGTDVYTDDSSIGQAAVHAGLISLQYGGTVTIEIRGAQSSFQGSKRNGLTSNSYGQWYGSFIFVR